MRLLRTLISSSNSLGLQLLVRRRFQLAPESLPMDAVELSLRKALAEKQSAVEVQGNAVRALKAAATPASKLEIDAAIETLNNLKLEKASIEKQLQARISDAGGDGSVSKEAFRQAVVNTLERRLFYIPSFKIYRGVAGLYDYGPPGCAVKSNVLSFWRQVGEVLHSIALKYHSTPNYHYLHELLLLVF